MSCAAAHFCFAVTRPCVTQEPGHDNVTAHSVLRLLHLCRRVILQDSAFWRHAWPQHDLWNWAPEVFGSPELADYHDRVLRLHELGMAHMAHVPRNSLDQVQDFDGLVVQMTVAWHAHGCCAAHNIQFPGKFC